MSTMSEANCMNCRNPWTDGYMLRQFKHTFVRAFWHRRVHLICEFQKSFMPLAATMYENMRRVRELRQRLETVQSPEEIDELARLLANDIDTQCIVRGRVSRHRYGAFGEHLQADGQPALLPGEDGPLSSDGNALAIPAMVHCPITGCNGAVSGSRGSCMVCNTPVCTQCVAPAVAGHVCNPEDVASVAEIASSARACPQCGTRITRSHGCDQMWCTRCFTAFDYNTGRKMDGRIHNPHYFEYLARQPVAPIDFGVRLGRWHAQVLTHLTSRPITALRDTREHLETMLLPAWRRRRMFLSKSSYAPIPMCIKYMRGDLSEGQWRRTIHMELIREKSANEVVPALETALDVLVDAEHVMDLHVAQFLHSAVQVDVVAPAQTLYESVIQVIRLTNRALHDIHVSYLVKIPRLHVTPEVDALTDPVRHRRRTVLPP
jgi:hypothetical protein